MHDASLIARVARIAGIGAETLADIVIEGNVVVVVEHVMGFNAVLHFEALSRAIARHATGLVDHVANRGDLASLGELIPWGGDSGVTVTVIMGLEIP